VRGTQPAAWYEFDPLVFVLSEAIRVLVLEAMFFEYEHAYAYDSNALYGWTILQDARKNLAGIY
jgi:hypothetical protein